MPSTVEPSVKWSWLQAHLMWRCYITDGERYCSLLVEEMEYRDERVRGWIEGRLREEWTRRCGPLPEKKLSK